MVYVFLSILFFFFQNIANKEYGEKFSTDPKTLIPFHVFTHIAMLLALLFTGIDFRLSFSGMVYAFLYGLCFLLAINILMYTLKLGAIGKTTLIVNLSMLLPMLPGILFWGETLDVYKGVGIPCVLLCLVLSVLGKPGEQASANSKKWPIFVMIVFFLDGSLSVLQKLFLKNCPEDSTNAFVAMSVVFGLLICVTASLLFFLRDRKIRIPASNRKDMGVFLFFALVIGASTALGTYFNMVALDILKEGIIVFPVRQGGLILMITVFGIIRYKEKFNFQTLIMLLSGIAGIILLNI